jgi:Fungal trichothecene efflux pump (TRI12)
VGNAIFTTTILYGVVESYLAPQIAEAALASGFPAADLPQLIPAVIENAIGIPEAFSNTNGVVEAVQATTARALKDVYGRFYRLVFYCTIPFGVLAVIAAWMIRDPAPT